MSNKQTDTIREAINDMVISVRNDYGDFAAEEMKYMYADKAHEALDKLDAEQMISTEIFEKYRSDWRNQLDEAHERIQKLQHTESLPLDRLMGQLANAIRNPQNHDFIRPFLETGINIIDKHE